MSREGAYAVRGLDRGNGALLNRRKVTLSSDSGPLRRAEQRLSGQVVPRKYKNAGENLRAINEKPCGRVLL